MINLIPNEEKKKKVQDFFFRLSVVFFAMLGFSFLIASISMLPAYFISREKKNLANIKLELQQNESLPIPDQETLSLVEDLDNKLSSIERNRNNKYLISQKIINEIILEKMSDIKITEILYQNNQAQGKTVSIRGAAPSRERLLLFRKKLEENALFQKVDLPVSNFVRGTNIRFSLSLIPF
ncbi:MAG: hypothetical protein AAB809_00130 [Patescibacteria group bacterium]